MILPASHHAILHGARLSVEGRWAADTDRVGSPRFMVFATTVNRAGYDGGASARYYALRGAISGRIRGLFPRRWALVDALILAEKSGLDPEIRETFALAGLAHMLAISGFHVGVIGGVFIAVLLALGFAPVSARTGAALAVWGYVVAIGLPDAAVRAAALLSISVLSQRRAHPTHHVGGLAAAWLIMLLLDPEALGRIGFQLSFAGAFGLAVGSRPLEALLKRILGRALPAGIRSAVAAGISATLFTLPLVAWHFERVSIVGIPATLLIGPLIALALPGILMAGVTSVVWPALGRFVAGGVEWTLDLTLYVTELFGGLPFASVWIPRTWVPLGALGAATVGFTLVRWLDARGRSRRVLISSGLAAAIIAWPAAVALSEAGTVEIVNIDVGQGDAIAIRSPRGRWLLVDTGPAASGYDAGARVVLPYLRRRGVGRLTALILTHPDLDHIGGAASVLEDMTVDVVFDPGFAEGKTSYIELLAAAERADVPWLPLVEGRELPFDGAVLRVLHPPPMERDPSMTSSNDRSVVFELRYGGFSMLMTGDAEAPAEERMTRLATVPDVDVLKVGHHGSSTSTTAGLLDHARPEVALVPVGERNRYGHPDAGVMARLTALGVTVYRTDEHGTTRVVAERSGRFSVETERGGVSRRF